MEELRAEIGADAERLVLTSSWDARILTLMRALEGVRVLVEPLPPENDSPKQVTARKDYIALMIWQAVERALLRRGLSAGASQNSKAVKLVGKIMV
jgi:hypothetical protein